MNVHVVDSVSERHDPPSKQAIEEARERQLQALKALRRQLKETLRIAVAR